MLNKREKLALFATMGVIIFSVVFNIFIAPVLNKNAGLNKEIYISRLKLKRYLRLLSQKGLLQEKYNKWAANSELPEAERTDTVSMLAELKSIANNSNIQLIDIRPEGLTDSGTRRQAIIDVRTEGDIEGYLKFIYTIENSLTLLKIKKMQLNFKPDSQTLEGDFAISRFALN